MVTGNTVNNANNRNVLYDRAAIIEDLRPYNPNVGVNEVQALYPIIHSMYIIGEYSYFDIL